VLAWFEIVPPAVVRFIKMMNIRFRASNCDTRPLLSLGLLFAILVSFFGPPVSQAQTSSKTPPPQEHFVLYQSSNGDTMCREATPAERVQLDKINPRNLQPINHLDKGLGQGAEDGQHLTIHLLGTAALNSPDGDAPLAKAAFTRAATVWENIVTSPVTLYIDVDYGSTNFGQAWGANTLGSTAPASSVSVNYSVFRNSLINGAANLPAKLAVYNALPASTVPTDLGNSNTVNVNNAIARATGFLPATAQESDSKPRIAFNSAFTFDFDPSDGIVGTDFEAVATHEIGHALGFTSRSGGGGTIPAVWDLYRFRSGTTSQTFTSAQRIMTIGGPAPNSQFYFVPGINELALSDGGPNQSEDNNADGNQSSHWKQAILNGGTIGGYIGIMDPKIPANLRRLVTQNDINALQIFGYNSDIPPPPPPPANDNFASAQIITGCSGSVNGTNLNATKETNEPNHSPDNGGGTHSVWYSWQAPTSGTATFTTAGSTFDTVLAVYTGTAVDANSLTSLGKSDDNSGTDKTSTVTFGATSGTIYRVAVDGYNNAGSGGGEVGPITLNWSEAGCSATPTLTLMLTDSGAPDQTAAVDAILRITDPFPVINSGNLINPPNDRNTRVVLFVGSLAPGTPASSVVVNLVDGGNQSRDIPAEDVRLVPGFDFSQVTFRLPDNLAAGTYHVKVVFGNQFSNTTSIRVGN